MKTLLIMCGAGHATSTVVRTKLDSWLKQESLTDKVTIKQSSVGQEIENIKNGAYDIVVSTTQVPKDIEDKVIMAIQLLTGIGADPIYSTIKERILS